MRRLKEVFRIVLTGVSAGPTKMWAESVVEDDDDMSEPGTRTKFRGVDFKRPVSEIWQGAITKVKTNEDL